MSNMTITFSYPWLLLVLIPAILVSLIPYFRLNRKYRRTRNRITSLILHTTVMVLAIMLLAGMRFDYFIPNTSNKIILLVDQSDTQSYSQETRDAYVQDIITNGSSDAYNVGVVTFGFDQVYAVPVTNDLSTVYSTYLQAEKPDTTSSNIAAALQYTAGLFNDSDTGKIILITDGEETEEDALTAIKYVTAKGIRLDVIYVPSEFNKSDVQVVDVLFPDYKITKDSKVDLRLSISSSVATEATVALSDNGSKNQDGGVSIAVQPGLHTYSVPHTFTTDGIHKLDFDVQLRSDGIEQNNRFSTYYNLQLFNNVLLISRNELAKEEESKILTEILSKDDKYTVTNLCPTDGLFPTSVDELREYDQVILNNIANSDLPVEFVENLNEYVHEYGGGLLTVGGSDGEEQNISGQIVPTAHAYDRDDMYGTLYQQMLPVEAIKYTPPVGVMFLVDISGSMSSTASDGVSRWEWSKVALASAMNALTERDYMGIIAMETSHQVVLPLTPLPQQGKIREAISKMPEPTGGTTFCSALRAGCQELAMESRVEKRHVVIITDGQIGNTERAQFEEILDGFHKQNDVTLSMLIIGGTSTPDQDFNKQLIDGTLKITPGEEIDYGSDIYKGMLRCVWIGNDTEEVPGDTAATKEKRENVISKLDIVEDPSQIPRYLRQDLEAPDIKEVDLKEFQPYIANLMSPILNGVRDETGEKIDTIPVSLTGFYGTKVRSGAEIILTSEFKVPIYAHWKYGKGRVGSFMADLYGEFTETFVTDEKGQRFILNVVESLTAYEDIRGSDINVTLTEDNYINRLSIMTNLQDGEKLKGTVSWIENGQTKSFSLDSISDNPDKNMYVTSPLSETNNYSRASFIAKLPGVSTITITKVNAQGEELSSKEITKAFSYSKEYDELNQKPEEEIIKTLNYLAEGGSGYYIDDFSDVGKVFETFITEIHKYFDPRVLFSILIIVLFLIDIAVRKFKFKWPHEIIRDIKAKKQKKK